MLHLVHASLKFVIVIILIAGLDSVNISDSDASAIRNTTNTPMSQKEAKEYLSLSLKEEARKKSDMMSRIMPLMVIPFMISTAMIPMMLMSLKFMLLKSGFTGTLAVILMLLNMFRSRASGQGGVFNHNIDQMQMSMNHYGYTGGDEYGAYVNRKRKSTNFR